MSRFLTVILLAAAAAPLGATVAVAELSADCGGGTIAPSSTDPGSGRVIWTKSDNSQEVVYSGGDGLIAIAQCGTGVVSIFQNTYNSNKAAYYSPNCRNIGGTGSTERVWQGSFFVQKLLSNPAGDGVFTTFVNSDSNQRTYFSPDCLNIGGGGKTISISE